jgi:hypothetical protein
MKNSLASVIFKEKKSTIFSIILKQLEKWENYKKKDVLPESPVCSIVLKANYLPRDFCKLWLHF